MAPACRTGRDCGLGKRLFEIARLLFIAAVSPATYVNKAEPLTLNDPGAHSSPCFRRPLV
jgi:hypothetical protein